MEDAQNHYIRTIELLSNYKEALPVYQFIFKTNNMEIWNYMNYKKIDMESMTEYDLLDNIKLLGKYSDCPSDIKHISNNLTDENIFNVCKNILNGIYSNYPSDINKVDDELINKQDKLNKLQMIEYTLKEMNAEEEVEDEIE